MELFRAFLETIKKDLHWSKLNKSEKIRAAMFVVGMVSFPVVACLNAWIGFAILIASVAVIPNKLKIEK